MNISSDQRGQINVLLIPFILTILLLLGTFGFSMWAFTERDTYKNKTDEVVAREVKVAVDQAKTDKDNEFVQKEKEPFRDYTGPEEYGSFSFQYPKTWSAYETNENSKVTVKLHPKVVPADDDVSLAAIVSVSDQKYDSVVKQYESKVKSGEMKAAPYKLIKVPSVSGMRFEGEFPNGTGKKAGIVTVLPLRDKTIEIRTESADYFGDYEKVILATFNVVP
jgi:hypothetical protein